MKIKVIYNKMFFFALVMILIKLIRIHSISKPSHYRFSMDVKGGNSAVDLRNSAVELGNSKVVIELFHIVIKNYRKLIIDQEDVPIYFLYNLKEKEKVYNIREYFFSDLLVLEFDFGHLYLYDLFNPIVEKYFINYVVNPKRTYYIPRWLQIDLEEIKVKNENYKVIAEYNNENLILFNAIEVLNSLIKSTGFYNHGKWMVRIRFERDVTKENNTIDKIQFSYNFRKPEHFKKPQVNKNIISFKSLLSFRSRKFNYNYYVVKCLFCFTSPAFNAAVTNALNIVWQNGEIIELNFKPTRRLPSKSLEPLKNLNEEKIHDLIKMIKNNEIEVEETDFAETLDLSLLRFHLRFVTIKTEGGENSKPAKGRFYFTGVWDYLKKHRVRSIFVNFVINSESLPKSFEGSNWVNFENRMLEIQQTEISYLVKFDGIPYDAAGNKPYEKIVLTIPKKKQSTKV